MADGRQPDEHWASNGENGYSGYSSGYKQNGYHGGAAAHPGTIGMHRSLAEVCVCMVHWVAVSFLESPYSDTHTPPDG